MAAEPPEVLGSLTVDVVGSPVNSAPSRKYKRPYVSILQQLDSGILSTGDSVTCGGEVRSIRTRASRVWVGRGTVFPPHIGRQKMSNSASSK